MNHKSLRKTGKRVLIGVLAFATTSCASILNPAYQKVSIKTDEQNKVLVDGVEPGMKKGKYLIRRNAKATQITLKREGYKDRYHAIMQNKKSPYYIMSIVPFAATFFPPFLDGFKKARNYPFEVDLSEPLMPKPEHQKFSPFVSIDEVNFDPKLNEREFIPINDFLDNDLPELEPMDKYTKEDVNKVNYEKVVKKLFDREHYSMHFDKSVKDELNISLSIDKLIYHGVALCRSTSFMDFGTFLFLEMGMDWKVKDENNELLFSKTTTTRSGEVPYFDDESQTEAIAKAASDAIHTGFIELAKSKTFQEEVDKLNRKYPDLYTENEEMAMNNEEEKEEVDSLALEKKGDDLYLRKGKIEKPVYNDFNRLKDENILPLIKDVPQLHSFTKEHIHNSSTFVPNLVDCYNDYKTKKSKGIDQSFDRDYRYKFGLITKEEWKNGPSEEMMTPKKPISGKIRHTRVTTTEYQNSMPTSSTTGENFRFQFTYGRAEYRKGFLLSNLKKAVGDDPEALKHIRKYRLNFAGRTSIFVVGLAQVGGAIRWAVTDKPPFGLSTIPAIAILAPGIVCVNWFTLFPQKYKKRNIKNAINAYNRNYK